MNANMTTNLKAQVCNLLVESTVRAAICRTLTSSTSAGTDWQTSWCGQVEQHRCWYEIYTYMYIYTQDSICVWKVGKKRAKQKRSSEYGKQKQRAALIFRHSYRQISHAYLHDYICKRIYACICVCALLYIDVAAHLCCCVFRPSALSKYVFSMVSMPWHAFISSACVVVCMERRVFY